MAETFDMIVRGGTVVNHDGRAERDIGIRGGRIAAIGALAQASAAEIIDAKGLHVLPGVIDTQVHFREPGLEHKEDLETGSRAAVMGGVTAVFEMPNTKPLTTSAETLADKVARARNRMFCDFAFYVGGTRENIDDIPALERLESAAGIKVFMGSSTGDLLVDDDASLSRIIGKISRRAAFHAEDEARLKERMPLRRPGDPTSHPVWRDEQAALMATQRLVRLAEQHGRRVHVLHVSTAEEMAFLAEHKDWASVEVTPHHLTLVAPECYERLGTYAQMNPPVRDERHRQAIWAAVANGVVDVLGSDHAAAYARGEGSRLSRQPFGHDRRADAGAGHARPRQCRPADAGALRRSDEPRSQPPVRHPRQGPHRGGLRRGFDDRGSAAPRDDHQRAGSNRAAAGRPMTGCPCRAGLSARSFAASASCGTAAIAGPAQGQPVRFA